MTESLTEYQVMDMVRAKIKNEFNGSQKDYADHCNISQSYLCDVLARRRYLGKAILRSIGLRMVITYEALNE